MSAEHHCPFCHKLTNYHPKKYHEISKCMHCKQTFGYKLYTVSDCRQRGLVWLGNAIRFEDLS